MSSFREDGSVESANSTNYDELSQNIVEFDPLTYRCLVIQRYFIDDELNKTRESASPTTTYNCIIIGGVNEGKAIDNVRVLNSFGGKFNNEEIVFKPSSITETQDLRVEETDGDIVLVTFINGNIYDPIIIGCDTSPKDLKRSAATKEDGQRWTLEFNAIRTLIDKTGKWIKTKFVGKVNAEARTYEPTEEVEIKESWETEKITQDFKSGLKVEKDGANDKMTITTAGNVIATFDGKEGKVTIDVDGTSIIEVNKDGTVTVTANTKINLLAPEVDVGDAAALSATRFEALKAELDLHTHPIPGNIGPQTTNVPTVPLIDIIGSKTIKINN